MKKNYLMKSISVIFMLLAMLFSCDQLTEEITNSSGNNTTQDSSNNNSGDNNSGNENSGNNQGGENNGENNEDDSNTITVDEALKIIANLTSGTHDIKIAGTINIDTFGSICSAISAISENTSVKINLDLSKTTGLTEISAGAFIFCNSLTSIVIPGSVTSIGNCAFLSCESLASVIIPDGVTSIGFCVFERCSSLASITIPASVTSISDRAFAGCNNLIAFNVSENNKNYSSSDDGKILYNKDKTELIAYPSAMGNITIPDNVTSIGDGAFSDCDSLTSITMGNNVTSIGGSAFYCCESLINITIPDSVTSIGTSVFAWCDNLTEVTMGNNVTSIGGSAFYYCESLTNIRIPEGVTSINNSTFEGCKSLTNVTLGNNVTYIGSNAFYECSNLIYNEYNNCLYLGNDNNPYLALMDSKYSDITSCEIDTNTKVIADGAFSYCNNLTNINVSEDNENYSSSGAILFNKDKTKLIAYPSAMGDITIPDGVTSINAAAFSGCSSLTSVTIGDSVTSIGEYAFSYCSSLGSLTIPDGMTSIGEYAFYNCDSLTSVTIGNNVTSIGNSAFYGCSNLTSVTFEDTNTWYYTRNENYTDGTEIDVTDTTRNAIYLNRDYCDGYWYKQ